MLLALLAVVVGSRPPVSSAMVRTYLETYFGVMDDRATVRRTRPDDFIVCFTRIEDLELVLRTPTPPAAPFALR